jgi:hypothetical protein
MAERLSGEAGSDAALFVRRAWLLAYSRDADDDEVQLAVQFIEEAEAAHRKAGTAEARAAALEEFCMGLMNTTEFIYAN